MHETLNSANVRETPIVEIGAQSRTESTVVEQACFHCGLACRGAVFTSANKPFCCGGCQTVFELLAENGLTEFYQLGERAGVRVIATAKADRLNFLDAPAVRERL